MKTRYLFPILLVSIILLSSCATMRVQINYDKEITFSNYKTYRFIFPKHKQGTRGQKNNPIFTQNIMNEIRPIMDAKGYTEAKSQKNADILIHFYTYVKNRRDWVPGTYRVGRWGRTWRTNPGHVRQYKEGTLGIDIVDRKAKALIWQGIGTDVLDRKNPQKNLVAAVEEVLSKYPPE